MRQRILLVLGLVVLALVVGVGLVAPRFVERSLTSALGVPVAVGWLWWNPATGQLSAGKVALGSGDDLITASRVAFKADLLRVLRGEVSVDTIEVDAPTAVLSIGDDNQVHFTALREPGEEASPSGPTPNVFVRRIAVNGGKLIVNYPVGTAQQSAIIEIVTFTASNLEVDTAAEGTQVGVSGVLDASINGAPVDGNVEIHAGRERSIKGKITVEGLSLNRQVLDLPAAFTTFTAKVDVDLQLDFSEKRDALQLAVRMDRPHLDGAEGTSFSAKSVHLPDATVNISERTIELGRVTVEAPSVDAVAGDAGLILPGVSRSDSPVDGPEPRGWSVTSKAIDVRGGDIHLRHRDTKLSLSIPSARWEGFRGDRAGKLEVSAKIADSSIDITGALAAAPLDAQLDVHFEKIDLAPLVELVPSAPLRLARGTAEGTVHIAFRGDLRDLGGRAVLRDLASVPPDPANPMEVLAVHTADFAFSYRPASSRDGAPTPARVDVPILKLSYPYAMLHRDAGGTFPYSLVASADNAEAPAAAAPSIAVNVETLDIEGGKIEFVDSTLQPSYWASLTGVTAAVERIRYPELKVAHLDISGEHDELSPAGLSGALRAEGFAGRATAQDVLLESLNAYVSPALGYAITSGRMSVDATLTPASPLLRSGTNIVLVGVDVSQTGLDAIQQQSGVPLPVAINLLENSAGEIHLQLPFVIDTESRQVSLGAVVWQTIRSAIVGALTYPLRSLGSLFGKNGAPHAFAVDPIPFGAGRGSLDDAGNARVGEIARIVHAHPGLLVVLMAQVDDSDTRAVGTEKIQALADARVEAVRKAFVEGGNSEAVPAYRIIVAGWTPAKGATATGRAGVYVELQDGD